MPSFKDKDGREWELVMDAPAIQRIREKSGNPQFMVIKDEKQLQEMAIDLESDPLLRCLVIYELCKPQREKRDLSEEQFYFEVLGHPEAIDAATDALAQVLVSFTPRRMRGLLQVFAEQDRRQQEAIEKVAAKISDPKLMEELMASLESNIESRTRAILTQLSSATASPDSSASNQTD